MSIATLVLGESGTGKSTSLRNMEPTETLLIQAIKKPLPFRSKEWGYISNENKTGNILVSDSSGNIVHYMQKTVRPVIVIDDFQYILANEFMRRSEEKGYDKFSDIGKHAWDILSAANTLANGTRVYILSHSEQTEAGKIKAKTIGRMLDDKITVEGLFSIVLRTGVMNDNYVFRTRNNGNDTVKTPMGMFESEHIDNDLMAVDKAITEYYFNQ